jgi:hypothetical protein
MSSSVMQQVERKLHLMDIQREAESAMPQSTADFFTVDDRKELIKQGLQMEQILRDLGDLKVAGVVTADSHEKRIRVVEDDLLTLRTEIRTASVTSRVWIGLISAAAASGVSLLMKLLWK